MAKITKHVDRGVAAQSRYQVFTEADAGSGDILMIKDSLGKFANTVHLESGSGMEVRFNVLRTLFPAQPFAGGPFGPPRVDLANGQEYQDETMDPITIAGSETFILQSDILVSDIQLVTVSGTFEIFVS